jgi:hypothetical protein|tara:strand:+ start:872 stop:1036 length:165 start_codon:yes stop_codon:yes gene_type:complete
MVKDFWEFIPFTEYYIIDESYRKRKFSILSVNFNSHFKPFFNQALQIKKPFDAS